MAILTREQILSADDITKEVVEVPAWGGEVIVKSLTGKERDQFEASMVTGKGKNVQANLVNARAKLVALSLVNEDGKRLFNQGDIEALGAKSADALNKVFEVARRLSGLSEEDIKELTENLEETQGEGLLLD